MHLYYWDKDRLENELNKFVGGQFQMATKDKLVFRGEIKECLASKLSRQRVLIIFNWLCECRLFSDDANWWALRPRWSVLKSPTGLHRLDVEFLFFYLQPDEERIKMRGRFGEICHFFKKDDHTNLVQWENDYVPYYTTLSQPQLLKFWHIIIHILNRK